MGRSKKSANNQNSQATQVSSNLQSELSVPKNVHVSKDTEKTQKSVASSKAQSVKTHEASTESKACISVVSTKVETTTVKNTASGTKKGSQVKNALSRVSDSSSGVGHTVAPVDKLEKALLAECSTVFNQIRATINSQESVLRARIELLCRGNPVLRATKKESSQHATTCSSSTTTPTTKSHTDAQASSNNNQQQELKNRKAAKGGALKPASVVDATPVSIQNKAPSSQKRSPQHHQPVSELVNGDPSGRILTCASSSKKNVSVEDRSIGNAASKAPATTANSTVSTRSAVQHQSSSKEATTTVTTPSVNRDDNLSPEQIIIRSLCKHMGVDIQTGLEEPQKRAPAATLKL